MKQINQEIMRAMNVVAPHAGAWIETSLYLSLSCAAASPPTRGRGLKHLLSSYGLLACGSPPTRGRGLKRVCIFTVFDNQRRPPRGGVD